MDEVYGPRSQFVLDPEWISMCGQQGLTALSKNPKMCGVDEEKEAIVRNGTLVVHLASATIRPPTATMVFGRHLVSITRWSRDPAPGLWKLYHDRASRYL